MKAIDTVKPQSSQQQPKKKVETFKTILITVLVTGIVAFLGGMHVADQNNSDKQTAIKTALTQGK